jgi:hypothetical protein
VLRASLSTGRSAGISGMSLAAGSAAGYCLTIKLPAWSCRLNSPPWKRPAGPAKCSIAVQLQIRREIRVREGLVCHRRRRIERQPAARSSLVRKPTVCIITGSITSCVIGHTNIWRLKSPHRHPAHHLLVPSLADLFHPSSLTPAAARATDADKQNNTAINRRLRRLLRMRL